MRVEPPGCRRESQRLIARRVHEFGDDLDLGREEEVERVERGVFRVSFHREDAVLQALRLDPLEQMLCRGEGLVGRGLPEPPRGRLMREPSRLSQVPDAKAPLQGARGGENLAEDRVESGEREGAAVLARQPLEEVALAGRVQRRLPCLALSRADPRCHLGALGQEPHQVSIDAVDARAEVAEVSHAASPSRRAVFRPLPSPLSAPRPRARVSRRS